MTQHATVVYYTGYDQTLDAFYVPDMQVKNLQGAFYDHDIQRVYSITIETVEGTERNFQTLYTEHDIQSFLTQWNMDVEPPINKPKTLDELIQGGFQPGEFVDLTAYSSKGVSYLEAKIPTPQKPEDT